MTEHLQTNDRPNIQTYALCAFTFSLQTFTIFFRINAFINVYYNLFDVYHIYDYYWVYACRICRFNWLWSGIFINNGYFLLAHVAEFLDSKHLGLGCS